MYLEETFRRVYILAASSDKKKIRLDIVWKFLHRLAYVPRDEAELGVWDFSVVPNVAVPCDRRTFDTPF